MGQLICYMYGAPKDIEIFGNRNGSLRNIIMQLKTKITSKII